jgi:hypothetical protein
MYIYIYHRLSTTSEGNHLRLLTSADLLCSQDSFILERHVRESVCVCVCVCEQSVSFVRSSGQIHEWWERCHNGQAAFGKYTRVLTFGK